MVGLGAGYERQYDAVLQEVSHLEDEDTDLCAFYPAIGTTLTLWRHGATV